MLYHDKSSFELKQWRDYCKSQERAAVHPLGHLSGKAGSERTAKENRSEVRKIDTELRKRGDD